MAANAVRRKPGNPAWQPGVSGNPTGKPHGWAEFRALCREYAPQVVHRLVSIAMGEPQVRLIDRQVRGKTQQFENRYTPDLKVQVAAGEVILDRAYGRPVQPISGQDEEGNHTPLRIEQIVVRVRDDLVDANGYAKTIEHRVDEEQRKRGR